MATHPNRAPRGPVLAAGLTVAVVVSVAVAVGIGVASENDNRDRLAYTGELSSMNLPVVETPGIAAHSAEAGGVVVDAARWTLGSVPLDVAVLPTWELRNTGSEPVTVGEPHPEIRAGCCPGPFAIDSRVIEPGGTATLSFELAMHQGMDGWHDIAVHVPVAIGDEEHVLDLEVSGDFES